MHALHRPHLPRLLTSMMVTVVLAIVLSLAIASGLSNGGSGSASGPASAGGSAAAVQSPVPGSWSTARPFATSPFNGPLTAPTARPWGTAVSPKQTHR